jgi:hypothetical protein
MWFPFHKDNGVPTIWPWYNQKFFNPWNPRYSVAVYPIPTQLIVERILSYGTEDKVWVFYDASTSQSYLIQPSEGFAVFITKMYRSKKKAGYQIYDEDSLIYTPLRSVDIAMAQALGELTKGYTISIEGLKLWIGERVSLPSESTNAHHAYEWVFEPSVKPMNWLNFPMSLLAK